MLWFCNHQWQALVETTTESKAEHCLKLTGRCPSPPDTWAFQEMFQRYHIVVAKCQNCGKIKQFTQEI